MKSNHLEMLTDEEKEQKRAIELYKNICLILQNEDGRVCVAVLINVLAASYLSMTEQVNQPSSIDSFVKEVSEFLKLGILKLKEGNTLQ